MNKLIEDKNCRESQMSFWQRAAVISGGVLVFFLWWLILPPPRAVAANTQTAGTPSSEPDPVAIGIAALSHGQHANKATEPKDEENKKTFDSDAEYLWQKRNDDAVRDAAFQTQKRASGLSSSGSKIKPHEKPFSVSKNAPSGKKEPPTRGF